jgi:hypothetical protein
MWIVDDRASRLSALGELTIAKSSHHHHSYLPRVISSPPMSTILSFQSIQTYIVDTFTLHAASGTYNAASCPHIALFKPDFFCKLIASQHSRRYRFFALARDSGSHCSRPPCTKPSDTVKATRSWPSWPSSLGVPRMCSFFFPSLVFFFFLYAIVDSCGFVDRGFCGFMGRRYGIVASMGEKSRCRSSWVV